MVLQKIKHCINTSSYIIPTMPNCCRSSLCTSICFNIHVCVTSVRTTEVASPDLLELECYIMSLNGLSNVCIRVQYVCKPCVLEIGSEYLIMLHSNGTDTKFMQKVAISFPGFIFLKFTISYTVGLKKNPMSSSLCS